jgi:hypothetical protein
MPKKNKTGPVRYVERTRTYRMYVGTVRYT